ncbi:MAG: HD domain-containing protein [Candidatus Paceibacterota bacterium]
MIHTPQIQKAIHFAIQIHETDQKQKRKGKDVPYVTHPLTVGLILARAGADEDVITAGVLHDTIEDSTPEHKITRDTLLNQFNESVANLVESVSETDKSLSWVERKKEALEHVRDFSQGSLLLKSADLIANTSDIIDDYHKEGEEMFDRFNAEKEDVLNNYINVMELIMNQWSDNPLTADMERRCSTLREILA